MPSSLEQVQLAKAIGARLREAREMQGMSQTRAAFLLGYRNSSKLTKVEAGMDGGKHAAKTIPIWLLRKAAMIYQVSLDYLFGLTETMESDEPRHDAQREMILLMREEWERQRWRDMLVTRAMQERVEVIERLLVETGKQAEQVETALERVRELDGDGWQDLAGGARLERTLGALVGSVITASERLDRIQQETKAASGGVQLEMELIYG